MIKESGEFEGIHPGTKEIFSWQAMLVVKEGGTEMGRVRGVGRVM